MKGPFRNKEKRGDALDDRQTVELFLKRDETAIGCCKEKYGRRLRNIAFGILNNAQDAEECENDTYLEAWNKIPPHEPYDYLFAFLARIIRCKAINMCRKKGNEKHLLALSDEMMSCIPCKEDAVSHLDAVVLGREINAFLRLQTEEKRNIFLRRYWYADTISEIAKRFSLREGKVKMTLSRLRNSLKEYLKKEGYSI